jgi:CRP/FNR family cyclic AMP-dependent transcriptional regulator
MVDRASAFGQNATNDVPATGPMKTPYGLPDIEDCVSCTVKHDGKFCDMPDTSQEAWSGARRCNLYPSGAVLFVQEQSQRDICVICVGRVKLYSTTPDGKTIIHWICEAGEVLGLSAALEGNGYEATAETLEPCVISFINTEDLRRLMKTDSEVAFRVARHLSFEVRHAWSQIQTLGSQSTATEKLARFLVSASASNGKISMHLTHKEVADMLGVARETVTRSLTELI